MLYLLIMKLKWQRKMKKSIVKVFLKLAMILVKKILNWSYNIKLKDGLQKTYDWISSEMQKEGVNISRFTKS